MNSTSDDPRSADSDSGDRTLVIDTDTAGDDAIAILMAVLSDRVTVEGLTMVSGNVAFEYEVENAKYTLSLAGREDIPVHEGARTPLLKDHEFADYVHGEDGLGGDLYPDTGIESADEHAVDYIVRMAREHPGEVTLACIGPLTNVALALQREPNLDELLDEVWIMGGAVNTLGNVTPAAEFNFWVDPDAAKIVLRELDTVLVDWGVCVRHSTLADEDFDAIESRAGDDPLYTDLFAHIAAAARDFVEELETRDSPTFPDPIALACLLEPDIVEASSRYAVDVDEREGMTRGYSMVDEDGVTDLEARTEVVEAVDGDRFSQMVVDTLVHHDPHDRQ